MQVQIKKQLKIELDEQDIIQAVALFLKTNNIKVDPEDMAKINFVKSAQTGLRASLNVTEAETIEDEPRCNPVVMQLDCSVTAVEAQVTNLTAAVGSLAGQVASIAASEPAPVVADEEPAVIAAATLEGPGDVEPSTVEDVAPDVMPSVTEMQQLMNEDEPVPPVEEAPRKASLFL